MGVSSGAESPVLPTYAELRSADGTSWLLVFAAGSLQASKTYNLGLVPNALEDSRGMGVVISGREYSYSFISDSCSNHGLYIGGVCICHVGYAGNDCEHCAQGFHLDENKKCVQNGTITTHARARTHTRTHRRSTLIGSSFVLQPRLRTASSIRAAADSATRTARAWRLSVSAAT